LQWSICSPIVHFVHNNDRNDQESLRALLLMAELEKGEPISQREIAGRLGIALGLVNSYLKSLVKRGWVQVKAYPRNRYAYLLTPSGLAEKSHLACRHLSNFHRLYRITRQDSLNMFHALRRRGGQRVAFCGLDDLTEITFLSLLEAQLELAVVMDEKAGGQFVGYPILSLAQGVKTLDCPIFITSLPRLPQLKAALCDLGVEEGKILTPSYSYGEVLRG
jgi:DNA-binding MarR family transcriptional regulator